MAVNDLKIFIKEGKIPYNNNVSIDKNKGWPNIKNKISNIKENTNINIDFTPGPGHYNFFSIFEGFSKFPEAFANLKL